MPESTKSNVCTVYVSLLGEGTVVLRPVDAIRVSEDVFILKSNPDYDQGYEIWEYLPGSKVRCVTELRGGSLVFVAREQLE